MLPSYDQKRKKLTSTPYALDKKASNFAQGLDLLRSQMAIYNIFVVFQEESESEVEKKSNFGARREKLEKPTLGVLGSNFLNAHITTEVYLHEHR